ncbi:MAG TPA: DUF4127 family protein [Selenomonadales bacterium]|nr:DUF4127 family protein [Selenomonadales bacterium]
MRSKYLFSLAVILIASVVAVLFQYYTGGMQRAEPVTITRNDHPRLVVALVPLDSRPPCTQFVDQLARLAGMELLLPPPELLDSYKQPSDKMALRNWLSQAARRSDAIIVSTDMLEHGGLLASRLNLGAKADSDAVLALLEDVHKAYPQVKLYAFHIIPRLLIADSADSALYQQKMLKYSVLKDEISLFENPADIDAFLALEKTIPAELVSRYRQLYENNLEENFKLVDLVEQGVLDGLVIGQDDGQPFGLPNMVKKRVSHYVSQKPAIDGKVFVTRGTDEVALTLLGHIANQTGGFEPKVYVQYSDSEAPGIIMPFMPHSVSRTVQEKLEIAGARAVFAPDDADYTLFVHIGTHKTTPARLQAAARTVNQLVKSGRKVAVVDLSEDYYAHETLLPYLLKEGVDLTRLAAYAGWNTTSNSIGTAVTQASIFTQALQAELPAAAALRLYKYQLEFLTARYLDDWYFQKDVQPLVNNQLRKARIDANDLGANFTRVDTQIRSLLADRADALFRQALQHRRIVVGRPQDQRTLVITSLSLESHLPWQRTFEILVNPSLSFAAAPD